MATDLRGAYREFRADQFGGWPWPTTAPTHGTDPGRFVRTAGGTAERPPTPATT